MISRLFPVFAGKNERELAKIRPIVGRIHRHEEALQGEPEEALRELTQKWQRELSFYQPFELPSRRQVKEGDEESRRRLAASLQERFDALRAEFPSLPRRVEATPESLEQARLGWHRMEDGLDAARARYLERILPEAYAVVKNAARKMVGHQATVCGQTMTWEMVHFDVQLMGGIAIHRGLIAEMQTGEGKTLVATLPVYLNALTGLGVHVVTVNDYLARRDAEWMGELFRFLGLTVGCLQNSQQPADRQQQYACDITYGTNAEFGFDYLRDHGIARSRAEQVQRGHYFAIIDEIDSILIDEARTPLIITMPGHDASEPFVRHQPAVARLVRRQVELCNGFATEAKRLLEAGEKSAAGVALLKLKLGQPRHRQFLRMMEQPELRRLVDKTELSYQRGGFGKTLVQLKEELYFSIHEKDRDADLSEMGRCFLSPQDPEAFTVPELDAAAGEDERQLFAARAVDVHTISQLLKAYCLHERDIHYVVREGKVTIIDESTGREMSGRRWSDGLHQAVEAKEKVAIERENRTCATITIQNYFRLYQKLAGMTGTAETEAAEFHDIYQLDVLPIPTHRPNIRVDENDCIYRTRAEKYQAVVDRIAKVHITGQPVLVGTASVEASETLSRLLKRAKIPHAVLNAKNHAQEAAIVTKAGERGAVTVSTNMAGRGTDIKLAPGVAELGGLFVIGTERNPSRRVDRQLRGRCSRQGDPGYARFFLSLEDDLMRHHAAPNRMAGMIEDSAARARTLTGASLGKLIEAAQQQVEQHGYKIRKRVLDFDDVMNLQRSIVYEHRNEVIHARDVREMVQEILREGTAVTLRRYLAELDPEQPDLTSLRQWAAGWGVEELPEDLVQLPELLEASYQRRVEGLSAERFEPIERDVVLRAIDHHWQNHLDDMEDLREGVFLRSQGQKDPLVEYKNEAYTLFSGLMDAIQEASARSLSRLVSSVAPVAG
ncbi:preprotein translocase subunit SecA [Haloferula luteola]|uniref:Protein translocase subunit SecA n=1 Tax=Haloferula luteola TaxID=595692 RepID=A0A840VBZ9_9BACT|nr:preprotein translocase subunit SecA [Haloferula luteola]MBB5350401.1 preprotein translocase subunit SecA [Haloferula luteola]